MKLLWTRFFDEDMPPFSFDYNADGWRDQGVENAESKQRFRKMLARLPKLIEDDSDTEGRLYQRDPLETAAEDTDNTWYEATGIMPMLYMVGQV